MDAAFVRIGVPGYDGSRSYTDLLNDAIEQYTRVEAKARECKVKAVFEIHMGNICPSASAAYRFASNFDPEHVGAIFDPGNMICEGYENWQLGLEALGPYLAHVHVKNGRHEMADVTSDGRAQWRYAAATMRGGEADWKVIMKALRAVGYDGWLSLEDFSSLAPTEQKLPADLAFVKELAASLD
jgi:sugar phosphate isomerase/epimerase